MLTKYGPICTEAYDITKPIGGNYPDVPYYIKHLSEIGGRILEAMVGTGRLFIPLLEAGLNVEGIDASPEMLAVCRQHCAARGLEPTLYQGDVENLDLSVKFNAIVVSYGSFMLLEKRSKAIATLQAFARHLAPKGRIFIDLELPIAEFTTENIIRQQPPIKCPDGGVILIQITSEINWFDQVNLSLIRYEKWLDGQLLGTELQTFPLHWFGRDEFIMCLGQNGYHKINICANYNDRLQPHHHQDTICFSATLLDN